MNLNLLAFETSASRCGVALLVRRAQDERLEVLEHEGTQEHAERLLPMASQLLAQAGLTPADLQAVAFGQGPGGFTGLRVACGVAQGMALGLQIPVLPVVSHLAVAEAALPQAGQIVLVALDARMEEVYLAAYRRTQTVEGPAWATLQAPLLIAAAEVVGWARHRASEWTTDQEILCAGDAWQVYAGQMPVPPAWRMSPAQRPQAGDVARLAARDWDQGHALAPELAAPLYVRDKVAFTTAERERGEGGNPRAASALPAHGGELELAAMNSDDVAAVAALEASVQAFPWTEGHFRDALKAGYDCCVLRDGDRLAGFCVLMHAPDVSHVLVVAVRPDRQRQGLGQRLLAWCEARARAQSVPALLLEVRPSNQSALAFYGRQGFQQVGLRKAYYPAPGGLREDALVLQKPVAAGAGAS